jgi:tRNA(Ile)-lysidine synthase
MKLRENVREVISRYDMIGGGDHVVVGLSGGPDSVCLFHILSQISDELDFTLSAVHVNHGFRPGAAEADQKYVEDLCMEYGVPLIVKSVDVAALAAERGETPEEAGRTARYEAFADEAMRRDHFDCGRMTHSGASQAEDGVERCVRVAVAHNRNDQAETVLMRLIRGTGPDGLAGMPYTRRDAYGYRIIRPLLDSGRADIEAYCAEYGLHPRRDHTNDEPKYFRNKIRLQLLPFLMEAFGGPVEDAILRLSAHAAEDKEYFAVLIDDAMHRYAEIPDAGADDTVSITFPLDILRDFPAAVRHRIIVSLFAEIGLVQDIEAAHLKAADTLLERGKTGKSVDFPAGYRLAISYATVVFSGIMARESRSHASQGSRLRKHMNRSHTSAPGGKEHTGNNLRAPFSAGGFGIFGITEYEDEYGCEIIEAHYGNETARFDAEALAATKLVPVWRTRLPGDTMRPKGMDGTKKLQDIFVDKKIPRADRDSIMLFAIGSEVLWIPGIRISRMFG